MGSAIERFAELERGVLGIVRAADVYVIHVMARIRHAVPDVASIDAILSGGRISGFNVSGDLFRPEEIEVLKSNQWCRDIGGQIIVAIHTALEAYLRLKYEEYSHSQPGTARKEIGSLAGFVKAYKKLGIHLRSFDFDHFTSDKCTFNPKTAWDGIEAIDSNRHNIVHGGSLDADILISPMDWWYPFDLVRRWVALFDANFDSLIYQNRETKLIKAYLKTADRAGVTGLRRRSAP